MLTLREGFYFISSETVAAAYLHLVSREKAMRKLFYWNMSSSLFYENLRFPMGLSDGAPCRITLFYLVLRKRLDFRCGCSMSSLWPSYVLCFRSPAEESAELKIVWQSYWVKRTSDGDLNINYRGNLFVKMCSLAVQICSTKTFLKTCHYCSVIQV